MVPGAHKVGVQRQPYTAAVGRRGLRRRVGRRGLPAVHLRR